MNKYLKKLNRIEFVITYACTGRCRHCSEGEHLSRGEHMDGDAAVAAVHELCARYQIESLMTFGGEPLLYPDVRSALNLTVMCSTAICSGTG